MTSYVPNAFQSGAATAGAPQAYSTALRSYASNPFTGSNPGGVTSMAPHLSVAAADRPFASDISLLQGAGYGNRLPDLDSMWRHDPQTYQSQVSTLLREPNAASELTRLKTPPQNPDYVYDDNGNLEYDYHDDAPATPKLRRGGSD